MIACYSRVSTSEQAINGHSIDEQNDRMQKYCDAMGWTARKIYTDAGFSGANTDRPTLQKLIRDVKAGKIEKVLVYKLDRLSRSQKDTLYLIEDVFLANGCDFVSMSENFDTSSPFGRAMIGILAVFAQLEREQIKERMAMGKEARAKQGKFGGSNHVPIGYTYVDGELITNEFEKMQIIRIFNEYAAGKSPIKIASDLNDAGLSHSFGKWKECTIRNILTKKTYLGFTAYGGKWYKGSHDAFIDEDLFNRVQSLIQKKRSDALKYNRRSGRATSYLGGFLCCAECGAKYGKTKSSAYGHKYYYYACYSRTRKGSHVAHGECHNKYWKMDTLDSLIFDEIKKLSLEPLKMEVKQDDRTEIITGQIQKLDLQIERLMDLYSVGNIPLDVLQEKIYTLNEQRLSLESDLEHMETGSRLSTDDAESLVNSFSDILERGNFDEIRAVIGALIDRIEIDGDDVSIYWNFI